MLREDARELVDPALLVAPSVASPLLGLSIVTVYEWIRRGLLYDEAPPGKATKISIGQINEHRAGPFSHITVADLGRAIVSMSGHYTKLEAGRRRKRRST